MFKTLTILITIIFFMIIAGCAGKKQLGDKTGELGKAARRKAYEDSLIRAREAERLEREKQEEEESVEVTNLGEEELKEEDIFKNILFEYNKTSLFLGAREQLSKAAKYMNKNPTIKLTIEGHCDERASIEYNLALGEKRSATVKNYLVSLGVEEYRIETISYGEERPLDPEKTETAYAQNRRAQFIVLK